MGDRKNNKTMRRVEGGEECRRAAVFQDTFSCSLRFSTACIFLLLRKPVNPVGPTFPQVKNTEGKSGLSDSLRFGKHRGQIRSVFSRYVFFSTRYPCRIVRKYLLVNNIGKISDSSRKPASQPKNLARPPLQEYVWRIASIRPYL